MAQFYIMHLHKMVKGLIRLPEAPVTIQAAVSDTELLE